MNELFHESPLLAWPVLALVLFGGAFAAVVIRALMRPARSYDPVASLPLDDEGGAP